MYKFAVLSLAMIALAACDLPDPQSSQPGSQHAWRDAPLGTRIRASSVTESPGDSSSSTSSTYLSNAQNASSICRGSVCSGN
jgi:hypothetical protein